MVDILRKLFCNFGCSLLLNSKELILFKNCEKRITWILFLAPNFVSFSCVIHLSLKYRSDKTHVRLFLEYTVFVCNHLIFVINISNKKQNKTKLLSFSQRKHDIFF